MNDELIDTGTYYRKYHCPCCNKETSFYEVICNECLFKGKGYANQINRYKSIARRNMFENFILYLSTCIVISALCLSVHFAKLNNDKDKIIINLKKDINILEKELTNRGIYE